MTRLRFSDVVGQDDAKLALLLAACEPLLGGVLLRGHKGTGKTTLARGLADLLPGSAPFVELPIGATEDRVIGTIDTAALLVDGTTRFRPGLLAEAHGGVLYVDEINLLAPHLVDALLDAAASGEHRVERDGISHTHPARFVLVGSMNPEEGDLRPQLLDRFGLAVDLAASLDPGERRAAVRRQLVVERDGVGPAVPSGDEHAAGLPGDLLSDDDLRLGLAAHRPADLPDDVLAVACEVAVASGAEGLRADLMMCRAASALAGWERRATTNVDDLRRVALFVLAHRARRDPFDSSGVSQQELDEWFDQATASGEVGDVGAPEAVDAPEADDPSIHGLTPPRPPESALEERKVRLGLGRNTRPGASGRGAYGPGRAGRFVRAEEHRPGDPIAAFPTALALVERRATQPDATLAPRDLRSARREELLGTLVIIAVDTSSSMGAERRIDEARAVVLGLLTDAYQRRDRVALVTFGGEKAQLLLRPTASVEVARVRLAEVAPAGATPLADAIDQVVDVLKGRTGDQVSEALVVLITDGRATVGGGDPVEASRAAARRLAATGSQIVVVDAEMGPARLALCGPLAEALGADLVALESVAGGGLEQLVRRRLRRANA